MNASPRKAAGFSFLEVLIALSILLVGSVAVLACFALGVAHLAQRKLEARLEQVRPEVETIVQDAVDALPPGELPQKIVDRPLSRPNFSLKVEWSASPFKDPSVVAHAVVLYRGSPVYPMPPNFVTPSVLVRRAGGGPAPARGAVPVEKPR